MWRKSIRVNYLKIDLFHSFFCLPCNFVAVSLPLIIGRGEKRSEVPFVLVIKCVCVCGCVQGVRGGD